jgi:hypothetical protein
MSERKECSKCGRECKDKRGLAIHEAKCKIVSQPPKKFECQYCHNEFATNQSLHVHLEKCRSYSDFVKTSSFEEEKRKLLVQIDELKTKMQEENNRSLQLFIEENKKIVSECESLKNEREILISKCTTLEKNHNKMLEEVLFHSRENLNLAKTIAEKPSSTSIFQNILQNNNSLNLPIFDPSVIQGKINPPEVIVGNAYQLVNHILRLGFGNFVRSTDRSRKILTWVDRDNKMVKDNNGTKIARQVIEALKDELGYQLKFFEEKNMKDEAGFCRNLLNYNEEGLKEIQKLIIEKAKDKTDTSFDTPKNLTYVYFVQDLEDIFFPDITLWVNLTMYEFGKYIAIRLKDSIIIEGASYNVKNKYVVLKDDQNVSHMIEADRLSNIIQGVILEFIPHKNLPCITMFLRKDIKYNETNVTEFIKFLTEIEDTHSNQIMNGILDYHRRV